MQHNNAAVRNMPLYKYYTACLVMFKVHFIVSLGQFVNESLLSFIYFTVSGVSGQCASSQFYEKFRKILVKFMSSCNNFEIK